MILFIIFFKLTTPPGHPFKLAENYIENSVKETGSQNVVTGIYLDYRLYDSLFESLLLLISAVGIHYLNTGAYYEKK